MLFLSHADYRICSFNRRYAEPQGYFETTRFLRHLEAAGGCDEASGGRDPSFWPVHPAIERLYQYASLLKPFDGGDGWPRDNVCR